MWCSRPRSASWRTRPRSTARQLLGRMPRSAALAARQVPGALAEQPERRPGRVRPRARAQAALPRAAPHGPRSPSPDRARGGAEKPLARGASSAPVWGSGQPKGTEAGSAGSAARPQACACTGPNGGACRAGPNMAQDSHCEHDRHATWHDDAMRIVTRFTAKHSGGGGREYAQVLPALVLY